MADEKNKQPETNQVGQGGGLNLKPKEQSGDKIATPLEMKSQNGAITVVKDGNDVTIRFSPLIAQEIGSYRKAKVGVKFTEGGPLQFLIEPE